MNECLHAFDNMDWHIQIANDWITDIKLVMMAWISKQGVMCTMHHFDEIDDYYRFHLHTPLTRCAHHLSSSHIMHTHFFTHITYFLTPSSLLFTEIVLTHPSIHPSIDSFIHSFTHPFIHPLIPPHIPHLRWVCTPSRGGRGGASRPSRREWAWNGTDWRKAKGASDAWETHADRWLSE